MPSKKHYVVQTISPFLLRQPKDIDPQGGPLSSQLIMLSFTD